MLGISPMILRRLKVSSDSTIGTLLFLISESSRLCLSNARFGSSFFGESYIKSVGRWICEGWSRHLLSKLSFETRGARFGWLHLI
jgi:hypothetical protein